MSIALVALLGLVAETTWAQAPGPTPGPSKPRSSGPESVTEEPGVRPGPAPLGPYPTPLGPFISPPGLPLPTPTGEQLFGSRLMQRVRGGIVLTPTLTIVEEYNDNIFLDNEARKSDFITAIQPGLALTIEEPVYRLHAAYSFTSLLHADETSLNSVRGREFFTLEGLYRPTPRLTLSVADLYTRSENSNVSSVGGFSTGRVRTTSNSLVPAVSYSLTPQTTLRALGGWTTETFDTRPSMDSNTYRAEGYGDHAFSPRLTITGGLAFAYFDVEGREVVRTHTPLVGGAYRLTPTLTATALAGPQVLTEADDASLGWVLRADIRQLLSWGVAGLAYVHDQATTGGLGGVEETHTVSGQLGVSRLVRGLVLTLTPSYSRTESDNGDGNLQAFNISVQGGYQLASWLTVVAAYSFFDQRISGGTSRARNVDQNRIFVGLQFGYPLRLQ
jgi:hypothetical protein